MKKLPLLMLLFPLICNAEVMDKEPSLLVVSLFTLVGCISVYLSARYKPWLLFITLPFLGFFVSAQLSDVTDPFIGPDMAREAGNFYILLCWLSPLLILALTVCGLLSRRRHAKVSA